MAMEYRKLPHGTEQISALGMGTGGGLHNCDDAEIEKTVRAAIEHGINFFDLCAAAQNVYKPFGRAIVGQREKIYFQLHFGAVYNEQGEYAWSRDLGTIRSTIERELAELGTDYIDFGFLHCIDEDDDFDEMAQNGVLDYVLALKKQGVVRHLGLSSHTPSVAQRALDILGTENVDLMMFSINPAYDFERGDELGVGSVGERYELFRRCQAEGIGISVMKPFMGGKMLDAAASPFKAALTRTQCLQYALDRPGVLTTVPGVRSYQDLLDLLPFLTATAEEKDYSVISSFTPAQATGTCVYCNHCQPCPAGIDIGLVNKYYDLALIGDDIAVGHYNKLSVNAEACLHCGHCDSRCPFHVAQSERMSIIDAYFGDL